MYLDYFGLQRHPFLITPDPSMFCPGGGRGEILDALIYAITSGEGIIKVVGEVGSGKTMLCRILEERLPKSVEIVYLANPRLSPADILYAIAFELKLPVTSATERLLVMQHLQNYLLGQHGAGRSVVVFVEEAQGMPTETLEEIRLLSNLETHRHKLLQIVLFGQPELDNNLRKRNIRQLKERITHSFFLAPLGALDVAEYIRFRLQAAGCSRSGLFLPKAERMIARASCGLIRRVNILADKALLAAYAASAVSFSGSFREVVGPRHVRAAIGDCEFSQSRLRPALAVCFGLLLLVLLVATVFTWHRFDVASEKVSIDHIPGTAPALPPVSEQFSTKTAMLVPENHPQDEGESDRLASTTAHKSAVTPGTSLLEQRHRAATLWLQAVHPDNYTIQLLATDIAGKAYLEKFLQQISSPSMLEKIYICRVQQGGNDRWIVLYDEFEGVTSARRAVDDLPRELRQSQPFIRSLSKVLLILRRETP